MAIIGQNCRLPRLTIVEVRAAKTIRDALGIESDDVANYCFPKEWPANRDQRAAAE